MSNIDRYRIEGREEWRKWANVIPSIPFDSAWRVRVIPPFSGAMARFIVEANGKSASVYLDCFDALGCVGQPYWEVYPVDGDVGRCLMNETDELITLIRKSVESNDN